MSPADFQRCLAAWLDGTLTPEDSQRLQQHLGDSAEARTTFRQFTQLDASLRELAAGDRDPLGAIPAVASISDAAPQISRDGPFPVASAAPNANTQPQAAASDRSPWIRWVIAASALVAVGVGAYRLGTEDRRTAETTVQPSVSTETASDGVTERTIAGYATLRRVAGIEWPDGSDPPREGDLLAAGEFAFRAGVAEIDFFSGATLVVEGPARLDLESDWSVRLLSGRLRANVPPAARGFVVKAADSEIVDLGTEFALAVGAKDVRVKVIDGEIELRGGAHDGALLSAGEAQSLVGAASNDSSFDDLSTVGDVQRRHQSEQRERFERWKSDSSQLHLDDRLIAYYPIAQFPPNRTVVNSATSGSERDATIVGPVNRVAGRFGPDSYGLDFHRPGSRARTLIDGQFQAFTMACWVKVDSLDHVYNALLMADGYENGEPHWQIREDGKLMFSVMVDDTPGSGTGRPDAKLHRVYFSAPIWDVSMSGKWMHLAAVYDPEARKVTQFVNGQIVSQEAIESKFHITELRIGPAEIGNWGQPSRDSPWFAVRNLNGTIDEMAIFDAALVPDEIQSLFDLGKPLGY